MTLNVDKINFKQKDCINTKELDKSDESEETVVKLAADKTASVTKKTEENEYVDTKELDDEAQDEDSLKTKDDDEEAKTDEIEKMKMALTMKKA